MSGSIPPWKTVSASSSGNRRKRRRRSGPSDMKPVVIRRLLASASTKRNSTKSRSKTSLAPGYRDPIPCMPTMRMRKEVVSGTNRPKYWEAWTEEQQAKEGDGAGAKSTDPTTLLRLLIWNEHEDAVEQGGLDEHLADSGIPDVALSQEISRVTEPAPPIKRKILPDQLSRAPKPADPPITPPHPAHVAIPTATSSAPTSQIHSVLNRSRNPKWTTSDNVGKPIRVPQFPRVRPKTSAANTVQTVRTPLIMGRAHTAFTAGNQVGGTDGACVGRGRSKVDLDLGQVPIAVLGGPESFGQIM
ncbi:uncharacterized protein EV422DRAFT_544124 [Fimicolochytrium jonesii]|uniref:uncharacterized protein n=1 Tax=Fimicolochytrium jonesii TaxID=1396493 RepID=UPI0022FEAAE7|nr:uncharacterized protein EV422DRAFT_544124 [Fimicolochytrium jonesii]KAI8816820.1 hypothetical protein EV422DRAFT_544124 [Fimicolochytrium jonesii]